MRGRALIVSYWNISSAKIVSSTSMREEVNGVVGINTDSSDELVVKLQKVNAIK